MAAEYFKCGRRLRSGRSPRSHLAGATSQRRQRPARARSRSRVGHWEERHGHGDWASPGRVLRLRRRRAGRGGRRHRLHRQHAQPARHLDRRRARPEEPQGARAHRHAARHAFAQGAGGERPDGDQPRDQRRRHRARCRPTSAAASASTTCRRPAKPRRSRAGTTARQGRAPLRFRRPLRLHLADAGRLRRQHHDDHRPEGSGEAAGGRPLVDAGPMDRRRRDADVGRHRAPLPPSAAHRQPALHQLLARRLRHPRHRRHDQAEVRVAGSTGGRRSPGRRTRPAAAVRDPRPALSCVVAGRGRGSARDTDVAGVPVDGRHHRRDARRSPFASFQVEGIERRAAADHDRPATSPARR